VKWARHWLDIARFGEDDYSGTEVILTKMPGATATGLWTLSTPACRTGDS
jgi:hypothetical protein